MKKMGFRQSNNDPCINILQSGGETFIIAVYVDDIIFAGNTFESIQIFIKAVAEKFDVLDTGRLHHFIGIKISYLESGKIWMELRTYVRKVLQKFKMDKSKPVSTPVENGAKLVMTADGDDLIDLELYQSAVGSLLYLSTKTRPDIAYAVGNIAWLSSQPF